MAPATSWEMTVHRLPMPRAKNREPLTREKYARTSSRRLYALGYSQRTLRAIMLGSINMYPDRQLRTKTITLFITAARAAERTVAASNARLTARFIHCSASSSCTCMERLTGLCN
jgi:hypothetical protein